MRPRFRSESGQNATRDGRNLELVRLRRTQRDPGRSRRGVGRRRGRGGRGRPPGPTQAPKRTFWDWIRSLFQGPPPPKKTSTDHEARVISEFSNHYGLTFRDPALLKLALTHRSYLHVTGQRDSNERLEFLGDSILGLVTSEYLYRTHPTEHEGQLTKTKSLLVSKAILSRRALAMGLGRFVLMSHSEVESGGRQRLSILADAFESVVGAIYLDQGFEAGRAFIERWLLRDTRSIVADKRHTNYKSHLQEYVQSTYRTHPVYRIRSEMGPDHSKQFMVEVIVGKRMLGDGKGRNKKEAEQAAARNALERVERGPVSDRDLRADGRPDSREAEPARVPRAERPRVEVIEDESPEVVDIDHDDGDDADDADGADGAPRKRRRGRRGGRGRRRNGEPTETPAVVASETPSAPRPRPTPTAAPSPRPTPMAVPLVESSFERFGARVRAEASREIKPVEVEPMPRLFDEDEDEEVGRPEGPREGDVDPYAWGGADLRSRSVKGGTSVPPVSTEDEPKDEEVFEELVEEDQDFSEPAIEAPETPMTPSRPSESGPAARPPGFGRRRRR
jgi:ribonuclease-3